MRLIVLNITAGECAALGNTWLHCSLIISCYSVYLLAVSLFLHSSYSALTISSLLLERFS